MALLLCRPLAGSRCRHFFFAATGGQTCKTGYEALSAQLEERPAQPPSPRPNFEAVEAFLAQDFRQIYDTLEREEKRTLWRSIIKEIRIDNDQQVKGLSFL